MPARADRVTAIEAGSIVQFRGEQWRIAGLDAVRAHLVPLGGQSTPSTWLITEMTLADDFAVLADADGVAAPAPDPGLYADLHTLDTLEAAEREQVEARLEAVLLVREGRLPGKPPDSELEGLTRTARVEVVAKRMSVSVRTIDYWMKRYKERGIAGLTDRRAATADTPQLAIDPKWREAFRAVMDGYHLRSSITDLRIIELVRQRAAEMFGDDAPTASDRTLRRHLDVLYPKRAQNKKTARAHANAPTPDTWWRPLRPSRPGQVVAVDTNDLDVFALEPITGTWQQVRLLMAVDIYSRSIIGWRFTGWAPNAQDVKLLLRSIITPKIADPRLPPEGMWRYTGVPENVVAGLLTTDPILAEDTQPDDLNIAGIPVLIPDEITLDHGRDYASKEVQDACDLLGITLGYARPYTPTDKAHVERAFRTVNTRFCQALPGYRGPDVSSRGAAQYVEQAAFYTIDEIEERFAAWVAVEYQNTPHRGLRHPNLPAAVLTPNQMIDLAMGTAGFVPIPVDRNIHIELLTTVWRQVTSQGIQHANLYYDFPGNSFLDDYRNRPAPRNGRNAGDGTSGWRIKVDRRDLSRVYFFDYTNPTDPAPGVGQWREVPVRDLPDIAPFQAKHLDYAKRLLAASGGDTKDPALVARTLAGLLTELYPAPTDTLSREHKRLAARAYSQHIAERARRTFNPDDDVERYSGPLEDEDAEETTPPNAPTSTTTYTAAPPETPPTDRPPLTGFKVDETDEWDPFNDDSADID